jgi:hypothetical protein
MYRHRSIPADSPALVSSCPSSTYRTSGLSRTAGNRARKWPASCQCVGPAVEQARDGQGEGSDADRGDPATAFRSGTQGGQHGRRRIVKREIPRHDNRVRLAQRIQAVVAAMTPG